MKNSALFTNLKHHPNRVVIKIVTLLFLLIAGVIITAAFSQRQEIRKRASGGGRVDISMIPPTETINYGASSTFGLTMNTNGARVTKADIHLTFNPAQVQISFTKGTALPKVTKNFTITGSTAEVTLAANSTASAYKGNAGNLGSLTVKQIGSGNSKIAFSNLTNVATLPASGNAAGTLTGSAITARLAPANVAIGFNPDTYTFTTVPQRKTYPLNINTGGSSVSSVAAVLTYDPDAITIDSFTLTSSSDLKQLVSALHTIAPNKKAVTVKGTAFNKTDGFLGNLTITLKRLKSSTVSLNGTVVTQGGNPGNALGTPGTLTLRYPTTSPTPSPTPTGGPYRKADFLIKLDGVPAASAVGAKITVWFQKNGLVAQRTQLPVMTLTHSGSGVYKGTAAIPSSFPAGTKFNVLVRGEKHLITTFTRLTGQSTRCNDGQLITMPSTNTVTFNFTTVPLPAGDTVAQDNIVDTKDITRIEALLNKASTALTAADKKVGDLNYDGKVTFIDLGLIYKTLLVACPQY